MDNLIVGGLKLHVNLPKHEREDKTHLQDREIDRATSSGRDKGKAVMAQPHCQPNKGQQKTSEMGDGKCQENCTNGVRKWSSEWIIYVPLVAVTESGNAHWL